jgi:hypothetical protein
MGHQSRPRALLKIANSHMVCSKPNKSNTILLFWLGKTIPPGSIPSDTAILNPAVVYSSDFLNNKSFIFLCIYYGTIAMSRYSLQQWFWIHAVASTEPIFICAVTYNAVFKSALLLMTAIQRLQRRFKLKLWMLTALGKVPRSWKACMTWTAGSPVY